MRPEQWKCPQQKSGISATPATPLPLSIAFVRLIFSIFPALTAFGIGSKDENARPDKRTGKCFKQQLNNEHEPRAQDEYRSLPDRLYTHLHPYRALGKSMLPPQKLNELDLLPQLFLEQQQHHLLGGDEMGATTNTTTTTTTAPPDYDELQFYGQLKKLLDLPVLFAICFVQLISFVLVLNIEECSPLVLFSWWRNKIS